MSERVRIVKETEILLTWQIRKQQNHIVEVGIHNSWAQLSQQGQPYEKWKRRVVKEKYIPNIEQLVDWKYVSEARQEPWDGKQFRIEIHAD